MFTVERTNILETLLRMTSSTEERVRAYVKFLEDYGKEEEKTKAKELVATALVKAISLLKDDTMLVPSDVISALFQMFKVIESKEEEGRFNVILSFLIMSLNNVCLKAVAPARENGRGTRSSDKYQEAIAETFFKGGETVEFQFFCSKKLKTPCMFHNEPFPSREFMLEQYRTYRINWDIIERSGLSVSFDGQSNSTHRDQYLFEQAWLSCMRQLDAIDVTLESNRARMLQIEDLFRFQVNRIPKDVQLFLRRQQNPAKKAKTSEHFE